MIKGENNMPTIRYVLKMNDGSTRVVYTNEELEQLKGQYKSTKIEKMTDDGWKEIPATTIYDLGESKGKFDEIYMTPLQALEIIKNCFDVNGFDELIPNQNWWKIPQKERSRLLKEIQK